MRKSEIISELLQVRTKLVKLSNRLEKVRGVDVNEIIAEIDKAGTHITAAIREIKEM